MFKKTLSIFLSVIMVFAAFSVLYVPVNAQVTDVVDGSTNQDLIATGTGSIEKAISWAISIANDDKHGYSQSRRTGPDYDCSSFVSTAFKQAGFALDGTENTSTMKNAFVKSGFTWVPSSSIADYPAKSTNLKRGDVLLGSGHTALYIGNDQIVHAINGTYDKYDEGHPGDQTGNEIAVKPFSSSSYSRVGGWLGVLRYGGVASVDLGSKFYANIVPTATDTNGLASTGANEELAETGAGSYTSIPSLKISRVVQSGDRDCHWCSMITTVGYALGSYSYGNYTTNYRIAGKDYSSYNDAVSQKLLSHSNSHVADSDMSIFPVSMKRESGGSIGNNEYTYKKIYNLLSQGKPISVYAIGNSNHASVVIGYKENSSKSLVASGFVVLEVKQNGNWWINSTSEYNTYANSPQKDTDTGTHMSCYVTLDSWLSYRGSNKTIKAICYPAEIKNAPVTQSYQNLGDKFYANIVPTGASNKMAVAADSDNDVRLYTLDYSDYQKWLFERQSDNTYKITNVKTGKCLDLDNDSSTNKTNIHVYKDDGKAAQRWFIVKNGAGYYFVPKSHSGIAMDINGGYMTSGTNIQIYKQNSNPSQRFSINKTVDHKDIGKSFYANIICSNQNFAVSSNSSENVIIYKADYSDYQKWYFEQQADKTYKITNIKTGKCLDVNGKKTDNGTNIQVYTANTSTAQRWYVITNGDGYSLVPKCNINAALDVDGANFKNNTNVQEWNSKLNAAQRLYIQKTVNHKDLGETFYANIVSNDPAYSITADSDDNVSLQLTDNSDSQKWLFERQSDKTYRITNVQAEKCLDVNGAYTDNGTNIQVYNPNSSNAQKWYVITNGDGYSLVPKCSITSALDVTGAVFESGTNIEEWTIKNNNAQRVFINQTINVEPEYIELEDDFQLYVGDTRLVTVTIGPEEADQRVIWISEDPEIITIDDSGNVTAVGIGEGYISATTSNGLMTRCKVTVSKPVVSPDYITLSEDSLFLDIDQTSQISSMVYPEEANQSVIWYSEDDEIATVDEAGIVTGVGEGETIICAQTEDGSVQAYCSVYVYPPYVEPESVELDGFKGYVNENNMVSLYSYEGDAEEIIIPDLIDGKTVNEIYGYVFGYTEEYSSVTVPASITEIGYHAIGYYISDWSNGDFQEQKLTNLTIRGYKGSVAEAYATENGFRFFDIETGSTTEPTIFIFGDADGDGLITIFDVTDIQRVLAKLSVDSFNETAADVNGGGLDILDATCIQRWLAHLSAPEEIGKPMT